MILQDSCTDLNGTSLTAHLPEVGGAYSLNATTTGVIQIQDGSLRQTSSNAALIVNSAVPGSPDYIFTALLRVRSNLAGSTCGIVVRCDTVTATFYLLRYNATGSFELIRSVAGTLTTLSTFSQTLTVGNAYLITLEVIGNTPKGYIDGVLRLNPGVDSSPVTAVGRVGVRTTGLTGTGTGYHLDELSAVVFGVSVTAAATLADIAAAGAVAVTAPAAVAATAAATIADATATAAVTVASAPSVSAMAATTRADIVASATVLVTGPVSATAVGVAAVADVTGSAAVTVIDPSAVSVTVSGTLEGIIGSATAVADVVGAVSATASAAVGPMMGSAVVSTGAASPSSAVASSSVDDVLGAAVVSTGVSVVVAGQLDDVTVFATVLSGATASVTVVAQATLGDIVTVGMVSGPTIPRLLAALHKRILETTEWVSALPGGCWYGSPDASADDNLPYATYIRIAEQPIHDTSGEAARRTIFQMSLVGADPDELERIDHEVWRRHFHKDMEPFAIKDSLFRGLWNGSASEDRVGMDVPDPRGDNTTIRRWEFEILVNRMEP